MTNISLQNIKPTDKKYFARWWRDEGLISLTSGNFDLVTDVEVDKYFQLILNNKIDINYMIIVDNLAVGHISLSKIDNGWSEMQIVIGEKDYWNQGVGTSAIKLLLKSNTSNVRKIYLEVRPDNVRAVKAYEKCGFKILKTIYYPKNPNLSKVVRMEYVG